MTLDSVLIMPVLGLGRRSDRRRVMQGSAGNDGMASSHTGRLPISFLTPSSFSRRWALTIEPKDRSPSISFENSGVWPYVHSQLFSSLTPARTLSFCGPESELSSILMGETWLAGDLAYTGMNSSMMA